MNEDQLTKEISRLCGRIGDLTTVLDEIKDWLNSRRVETPKPADPPKSSTTNQYKCPICDAPMRRRTARVSGEEFYGCSNYPDCNGTRNIDGRSTVRKPCVPKKPTPSSDSPDTFSDMNVDDDQDVPF